VCDQFDVIFEMRGVANDVNQLKLDRIAKFERDIEGFAESVTGLVQAVTPDLAGEQPDDAVLQLEERLEDAKHIRDQQTEKDKTIASLGKRIEECKMAHKTAEQVIEKLQELAGAEGPDPLNTTVLQEILQTAWASGQGAGQVCGDLAAQSGD
jgi:alkanesulfonate monooxygenase SsuD/methylene tetrahydromethanopterin reductase-like flavin-dependent oxidoreductase (luciferase family)